MQGGFRIVLCIDLEWAERVAVRSKDGAASSFDGEVEDRPVVESPSADWDTSSFSTTNSNGEENTAPRISCAESRALPPLRSRLRYENVHYATVMQK